MFLKSSNGQPRQEKIICKFLEFSPLKAEHRGSRFPGLDEGFTNCLVVRSRSLRRSHEKEPQRGGSLCPGTWHRAGACEGRYLLPHILFPLLITFLRISLSGSKKNNRPGDVQYSKAGTGTGAVTACTHGPPSPGPDLLGFCSRK